MTEWKTVTLSDLGEIIGGATPATSRDDYYNGDIPWLTPKDLAGHSGRYISRGERNITQDGLNSCSTRLLPKNTVLFSSRAPIGYIAIAENDVCTNQGFKSIVPNTHVSPLFLYYLLKYYKSEIEAMGSGTTFKEVSGSTMRSIKVRVPVLLDIQQRIADILDALDAKIELNRKIIENLLQQIQLLYGHLAEELNGKPVELSSVVDVRDGTHDSPKPKETGFPLVTSKHLLPFGVDVSSTNFISLEDYNKINERSKVDTYDILLSMIGTVGLISLVIENPVKYAIKNVGLFKTSNCPDLYAFILPYLKSAKTTQHIERTLAGSTQKYISLSELRKMPIVLPSEDQLLDYNKVAIPLIDQIVNLTKESKLLASLRDALLPKLMSGELDVSGLTL